MNSSRLIPFCIFSAILLLCTTFSASAINLPDEFEDVLVLDELLDPASMAFAPDGRLFFGERITGRLRVAKYDPGSDSWSVEADPFYTFDVPPQRHRSSGLRGFAFDPDFAENGYVYAFYMKDNPRHNRVVRIQADPSDPDVALAGSETLLLEVPFNNSSSSGSHNGGDIGFGTDGMLYFTTGDGWNGGDDVQSLSTFTGKVFRIEPDGSIPTDNPYFNQATGDYRAIYALGLRNPYTMAFHPATGDLYINEARGSNKADVYRLLADGTTAGANFGHDGYDGIGTETGAWTNVAADGGKLVTGGAWYPEDGYWPTTYLGSYFVALWGGNGSSTDGRIARVLSDDDQPAVETFATDVYQSPGRHKPVMCKIGPDQNLYYLLTDYETGEAMIRMVRYTGLPTAATPKFSPPPGQYDDPQLLELSADPGATIHFSVDGSLPDAGSQVYSAAIPVDSSMVIRAIALESGLAPSQVNGGEYIIGAVPNIPPLAHAGPDLFAELGTEVTLNGAASYDPDGSPLEIVEEWTQLSGPPVTIADADETVANFTPQVLGTYVFRITVTDVRGDSDSDEATVIVVDEIPDVLDGLLARWRMETGTGNLIDDYSDNSNTGQLEGPAWQGETPDGSDFSLGFDGVDDRVDIGQLDIGDEAMSITFWFKATDFDTHDARFISKASGQNDQDHFWMVSALDGTRLRFRLRTDGQTTSLITEPGLLETDVWTHAAAVYDGAEMRLFLDGELVASTAKAGQLDTDPSVSAALGNQPADASGGQRPYHGLLDEVRIYGRALTPGEVVTVMNAEEYVVDVFSAPATADLLIYPQPARDLLYLRRPGPEWDKTSWKLMDQLGIPVSKGVWPAGAKTCEIQVPELPAGLYILQLDSIRGAWKVLVR